MNSSGRVPAVSNVLLINQYSFVATSLYVFIPSILLPSLDTLIAETQCWRLAPGAATIADAANCADGGRC